MLQIPGCEGVPSVTRPCLYYACSELSPCVIHNVETSFGSPSYHSCGVIVRINLAADQPTMPAILKFPQGVIEIGLRVVVISVSGTGMLC